MRMITWRAVGLAVAANVLAAGVALCQDSGTPAKEPPVETPRTERKIKTIFDFKAELGLTDKQEREIRDCLTELVKSARVSQAKLVLISSELEELASAEGDLKQIHAKLLEAATLQAEMRFNDFATSRKINSLMTPEQLAKWKELQQKARQDAPKK